MSLINVRNRCTTLAPSEKQGYILFSTDATASLSANATGTANNNTFNFDAASHGFVSGDMISIANGGVGGAIPALTKITSTPNATQTGTPLPAANTAFTSQPVTKFERFPCAASPTRIRITNLGTGETLEWMDGMAVASTIRTVASGAKTIVLYNSIWVTSNIFGVHQSLLPLSSDFRIDLDFK